jgi:DNA polymerase-1
MLVTQQNFAEACDRLHQADTLSVDLETDGLKPHRGNKMVGVAARAYHDDRSYYFPYRHVSGNLPMDSLPKLWKSIEGKTWIGHNIGTFDCRMIWKDGGPDPGAVIDSQYGLHLMDENRNRIGKNYRLKDAADEFLGPGSSDAEKELKKVLENHLIYSKAEMWRLPAEKVENYGCVDTEISEGMDSILIGRAMHLGIGLDSQLARTYAHEAASRMLDCGIRAREIAGHKINLGSPKQIATWLGLPSSDKDHLWTLGDDPRAAVVREFREWKVALTTYYQRFLQEVVDGSIHCNLKIHGTISGRLSCNDPNLQAIPRTTKVYRIKDCIPARPGFVLLQADYSQAEIRFACHYSREEAMADLLRSGVNIHQAVADELGIPYDAAKRINFSIIYGIGAETLGQNLHIPEQRASSYLSRYHRKYPGFRRLYNSAEKFARSKRYLRLHTGRIRHFNYSDSVCPRHKASSNLIQGCVAELLRERQTAVDHELRSQGIRQLLQVHDSAVMEVPEDGIHEVVPIVRELMEEHTQFSIPMKVDISYGPTLSNMQKAA